MLLCHKWKLQQKEGKAHTACAEGFEGEWNKLIILLWFKYFKLLSLFSEEMRVKECENIWYSKRFGKKNFLKIHLSYFRLIRKKFLTIN